MPATGGATAGRGFQLRRLEKPEELRGAEELQRSGGGPEGEGAVSAAVQRSFQDHGGLVLGAFADIYLAGCTISGLGWDGTTLYHYSYLTVVRPEYRNHHLGFQLKAFQRDEVLRLGLSEIRWVFDPLASRAAALYVRRLGASPTAYLPHYFGQPPGAAGGGAETDRLSVRWAISVPEVESRLAQSRPVGEEDRRRWERAEAVVETESGESGLRVPTTVSEPRGPDAHLEIPFDLETVREHEAGSLRRWRNAVRDAFRIVFDLGYSIDDFAVLSMGHERRSFYLMRRSSGTDPPSRGPAR